MRVVIAEDSVLLREGIARLLADAGFAPSPALAVPGVPEVRLWSADLPNVAAAQPEFAA